MSAAFISNTADIVILSSEHHNEQHLELLLAVDRVRVSGGHDYALALVQLVVNAVYRYFSDSLEAGDKCVAAGGVGAYLLVLVESEERYAQRVVLGEGLDLSGSEPLILKYFS